MPSKTEAYVARKFKFIISYHKRSRVEGLQEQCFQWFNNAIKNPCSWLIHTVVQQKLTQHCKAIILKKKKKFFFLLFTMVFSVHTFKLIPSWPSNGYHSSKNHV